MRRFFYALNKRFFDIVLSIIGIVLLFIPMVFIGIFARISTKGSAIFIQKRVGKNKKLFTIYKFRTMRTNAPGYLATRDLEGAQNYITKFGGFLRKTSLDELPQMFNILFGQMSIIGPRPVLFTEIDQIEERDKYNANSIKPGLTGLAQINGRDVLDIFDKARFDGEYVKKMSLWLDAKIFFVTIFKVLRGRGVREGKQPLVTLPGESISPVEIIMEEKKTADNSTASDNS